MDRTEKARKLEDMKRNNTIMLGEGEDESLQHTMSFLHKAQSSNQLVTVPGVLHGNGSVGLGNGLKQFLSRIESAKVADAIAAKVDRPQGKLAMEQLQLVGGYSIQCLHDRNKAELLGLLSAVKI